MKRLYLFFKTYPIPIFSLIGIFLGLICYFSSQNKELSHWVWLLTLIFGGTPIALQTIKGMFRGQFASDIVAMLAIITAIIMNEAFAGAVVVLMQSGGEALENYGLKRASSSLTSLLNRAPSFAFRKRENSLEKIDVKEVQIGDTLIVRPGDLIPVDGTILDGRSEIDESALTGEPLARNKNKEDRVFAGSVDINGAFEMRAEKTSEHSQYQKIVELVKKAQEEKAPIQRLADRYAIFFTPLALIMSFIGYLLTWDPKTILAVLVVATPCPLILATPLAILCGINKAAKSSIIVKGGAAFEKIGNSKTFVFDKTGTITHGTAFVEKVISFNQIDPEELLKNAASIEQLSTHSIAKAVVEKAKKELNMPTDFKEIPGSGVEGKLENDHYMIGSRAYLEKKLGENCFKNCEKVIQRYANMGKLPIFIAKNERCIGILIISDKIRSNAANLIQDIKHLGAEKIIMLTGDNFKNAETIAKKTNIQTVRANLFPSQKVEIIQSLEKTNHPTTMIGDGINDAPALATATVGVAMGAYGSAISTEAADIVFLVDDLSKLKETLLISKRTIHIAKESIFIGIGLSSLLMIIASFGLIEPAVGALLQEAIDVAVILNALRV